MAKLELTADVARRLRGHLRKAGRREIGGVLMGEQIAPDHFRIVDFSLDDLTGGAAHFVRSVGHHTAALERFFEKSGHDYRRFNYLGEWHSHPSFSVRPSVQDCNSMLSLVNGERSIDFAVLLICRLRLWMKLEVSTSMFVRGHRPAHIECREAPVDE